MRMVRARRFMRALDSKIRAVAMKTSTHCDELSCEFAVGGHRGDEVARLGRPGRSGEPRLVPGRAPADTLRSDLNEVREAQSPVDRPDGGVVS
jgi:hypothetical protein